MTNDGTSTEPSSSEYINASVSPAERDTLTDTAISSPSGRTVSTSKTEGIIRLRYAPKEDGRKSTQRTS